MAMATSCCMHFTPFSRLKPYAKMYTSCTATPTEVWLLQGCTAIAGQHTVLQVLWGGYEPFSLKYCKDTQVTGQYSHNHAIPTKYSDGVQGVTHHALHKSWTQ